MFLKEEGNSILIVLMLITVVSSGALLVPDILKNSKKVISRNRIAMNIQKNVDKLEGVFSDEKACLQNLSQNNIQKGILNEIIAYDGNDVSVQMFDLTTSDNHSLDTEEFVLKSIKLVVDQGSLGRTHQDFFDAKLVLTYLVKELGQVKEVVRSIEKSLKIVETDSFDNRVLTPHRYISTGKIINCKGREFSLSSLGDLCKTIFNGVYNGETKRCDHLLINDDPCVIYYGDKFQYRDTFKYDQNRRVCKNIITNKEFPISYHLSIQSPKGGGSLRVSRELDVDGAKFIHCDIAQKHLNVDENVPYLWKDTLTKKFESSRWGACRSLFGGAEIKTDIPYKSTLTNGTLVYNLNSLISKRIYSKHIFATGFFKLSDMRKKMNIKELDMKYSLDLVNKLRARSYYIDSEKQDGFIAQELREIDSKLVSSENGTLSVKYLQLIPHLINTIKVQNYQLEEIKRNLDVSK